MADTASAADGKDMCGIAGIINFKTLSPEAETTVARMITLLRHRGPDETGLYVDDSACLGHARLSIVGLSCGTQPIASADGRYWIVYNGEVFNYIELQSELEKKGYRFPTGTDTEVVLALYQELGSDCLQHCNGQFAIAIWDTLKKELFLARDRVGIRPLVYTIHNGQFSFASEIKALFVDPAVPRVVDQEALSQVFTFWTTITPQTAFANVYELPPGHFMYVREDGVFRPEPFWTLPYLAPDQRRHMTFSDAREELAELLKDAISLRLRADVPVGAYLSGGLDSSIITSLIAKNFNNRLRTFSMTFQENPFDESAWQNELVQALGTDHSEISVANEDIRDNLPQVVWHCEKPLLRTGPVPLLSLSKLVRNSHFKVVLTGEGADEVFGGYNIFKEAKLRQFWARQPDSKWRPLLVERLYPYLFKDASRARLFLQQFFSVKDSDVSDPFFSHQVRWRNSGKNRALFSEQLQETLKDYDPFSAVIGRLPPHFHQADMFGRAQFLEMDIFLSNYLLSSQGDRVGMANSIELRLPFLDYRVIEFAAHLPAHWKIKGMNEKYILKETFKDILPASIGKRPKQPYRAPIKEAFPTDEPGSWIAEMLGQKRIRDYGYFDDKKVTLLAKRFGREAKQAASETQNMALMGVLTTQLLHQQYVQDFDPRSIKPATPDRVVRNRE